MLVGWIYTGAVRRANSGPLDYCRSGSLISIIIMLGIILDPQHIHYGKHRVKCANLIISRYHGRVFG